MLLAVGSLSRVFICCEDRLVVVSLVCMFVRFFLFVVCTVPVIVGIG